MTMANGLIPEPPSSAVVIPRNAVPESVFELALGWCWCQEVIAPADIFDRIQRGMIDEQFVSDAALYVGSDRFKAACAMVADMARPATKQEIKRDLQVLVGSFPNAAKADLEIFGRALAI